MVAVSVTNCPGATLLAVLKDASVGAGVTVKLCVTGVAAKLVRIARLRGCQHHRAQPGDRHRVAADRRRAGLHRDRHRQAAACGRSCRQRKHTAIDFLIGPDNASRSQDHEPVQRFPIAMIF